MENWLLFDAPKIVFLVGGSLLLGYITVQVVRRKLGL